MILRRRRKKKQEEEQKREEKRKEVEAVKKKAEQVVPKEARLTKQTTVATVVSMQQVAQLAIEVRTLIKAVTSSIEATTPLISMLFTLVFAPPISSLLTYSSYCRLQICQKVLRILTNFLKMSS